MLKRGKEFTTDDRVIIQNNKKKRIYKDFYSHT